MKKQHITARDRHLQGAYALLLAGTLTLSACGAPQTAPATTNESNPASQTAAQDAASTTSYADATVSYLGPEGTYTQEACQRFFGGQGTYQPAQTVADAVQMLVEGTTSYAVVPQENTIGGPVVDYIDVLLNTPSVYVVGEVELPISQNLLVLPGTQLTDIKTVYSHKQGIAQSKAWLEKNLPNAEVIEASSTAEGARMVAEGKDASCAAIASAGCADVYGLEVAAPSIQQNDSNKTRFYVLANEENADAQATDRMAFVATGSADALAELLEAVEAQGMEVIAVHDRPQKTELGQYRYIVECAGGTKDSFAEVSKVPGFEYRYLGTFSVR